MVAIIYKLWNTMCDMNDLIGEMIDAIDYNRKRIKNFDDDIVELTDKINRLEERIE